MCEVVFLFWRVVELELRAFHLLGKHSTTLAMQVQPLILLLQLFFK
jgi:hypothetical protein